jgi:redox-sensitive bicupin YhaK (pirin superfamily)
LSYLFEGEVIHRDSEGFVQTIEPGAVNLMTAGRGIVHSERSTGDLRAHGGGVHGFQTWVALPIAQESIAPDFQHVPANAIPQTEGEGISLKLLAGSLNHQSAPTRTFSETLYADVALQQGARFRIDDHHVERAAYVISGRIAVTGQAGEFSAGQMVVFKPGSEIILKAANGAVRVLVLGGEPLDGKRHIFWNFVASRKERIEQAAEDWNAGRFKTVPGETEFIPLPESKPFSSGK